MMGLRGDPVRDFRDLKKQLRQLPVTMAHDVAKRTAPTLTTEAREAYTNGRTVYGDPRPRGEDGQSLDLVRTGATLREVRFQRSGTIVRCVLGTRYAKYLIGKYKILPPGNSALPVGWSRQINDIVHDTKVDLT